MSDYLGIYTVNGIKIIGDNTTTGSGIKSGATVPSKIVIPFDDGEDPILEIGGMAFQGLAEIREVVILAKINVINQYAFYRCENLAKINIPSSVYLLATSALDLKNKTIESIGKGKTEIFFEQHSRISVFENAAISNKEIIFIYICDVVNITLTGSYIFGGASRYKVYSYNKFNFAGFQTTYGSCIPPYLYRFSCRTKRMMPQSIFVFIILVNK